MRQHNGLALVKKIQNPKTKKQNVEKSASATKKQMWIYTCGTNMFAYATWTWTTCHMPHASCHGRSAQWDLLWKNSES
jgi:hypothetical protein